MTLSRLKHDFGFDLTIQQHVSISVAHPCGSSVPKACRRPCTGYRLPPMRVGGLTKPTRAQSLELLPKSSMALTEHGANAPSESEGTSSGDVTRLLQSARAGDRVALDRVLPLLYDDLRRLARRQLAREHGSRAIQPTTLVHEAYLKLAGSAPRAENRVHLLAIAAHAMRQVLVDHARERRAAKRGPEWVSTTLTDGVSTTNLDAEALL